MDRLITDRLILRPWTADDRDDFARMNSDPIVMRDMGGPISRAASDEKLDRYAASFETHSYGRWLVERAVENDETEFLGYAGVMPVVDDHPLGDHNEIGWRFRHEVWGNGFATEAASAALHHAFDRIGLTEVFSYTAADNLRSQAVMKRLGLGRDESLDFEKVFVGVGNWSALVWVTTNVSAAADT